MAEPPVKLLAHQQQLKRTIERASDNFKKLGRAKATPAVIRARMAVLKETWQQFFLGHEALEEVVSEAQRSTLSYFQDDALEQTEEAYLSTLDVMSEWLEAQERPVSQARSSGCASVPSTPSPKLCANLPPITLLPFDGTYENWEHFRDRFTNLIIINNDVTPFARMHYLVSCLRGSALDCVKDFAITSENFPAAWAALISRFENKRRLLGIHLASILNLSSVSRESARDLLELLDKVNSTLNSLSNLNRSPAELWHDMLVHIISHKLDPSTRKAWSLKSADLVGPPAVDEILSFIRSRARALEEFSSSSISKSSSSKPPHRISASTASVSFDNAPAVITAPTPDSSASSGSSSRASCPLCKKAHLFSSCNVLIKCNITRRRELVLQHKRCFNCLSGNHVARKCLSKYSCRYCKQKHHTLLHINGDERSSSGAAAPAGDRAHSRQTAQPEQVHVLNASVTTSPMPQQVLLATAWVSVRNSSGRSVNVRALLDQGSEMTFVSERVAQEIRLKRENISISVSAVDGVSAGTVRHAGQLLISPRNAIAPTFATTALVLTKLTTYAPRRVASVSFLQHLQNLEWADRDPSSSDPIDLIIGSDLYSEVILEGLQKGDCGQAFAQNSVFGWIISGPSGLTTPDPTKVQRALAQSQIHITANHCCHSQILATELQRFWEIEELPRKFMPTAAEKQCEEHFSRTHSRDSDGRYIVRIPFGRGPPIEIGESMVKARRCLDSLIKRFNSQPEQAAEYREFMDEYERLGHMRQAPRSEAKSSQCVFIPHHPVYRADSLTSKIRVVFNASSVTTNGSSLNQLMLAGPKLQLDLSAVILRWRNYRFVYSADIAKMYRQIWVDKRDIDFQRIMWQPASTNTPTEFQLLTVTYGTACALFLALRVLQQLVEDEGDNYPRAKPILKQHIYVDDVLFGDDNMHSLRQTRDQVIELLARGGFELRKWASNSPLLLSDLSSENYGLACSRIPAPDDRLKILGVHWNPARDTFEFKVNLEAAIPSTKRSILSAIARLYDPLGWVTPVTVAAKILIQRLWSENIQWDESVPPQLLTQWTTMYHKLSDLRNIQIPRWTQWNKSVPFAELHGFSDASGNAYAASVYLRVTTASGEILTSLLAGKSRVAPLKILSIPRLELAAAVLLARLITSIRESLTIGQIRYFCWTDSTIVLAWLRQSPAKWKTFVANRVAEVHSLVPDGNWRYVPTDYNPVDCASRGMLGNEILVHSLWWHGPPWLREPEENWPTEPSDISKTTVPEQKVITLNTIKLARDNDMSKRYSSWPKLLRITGYIFRFIARCRKLNSPEGQDQTRSVALTAGDISVAKLYWLKFIQASVFRAELAALSANKSVSGTSAIESLMPYIDQDGLLRVGGRLRHSSLSYQRKHPVLLASHPLVMLIIANAHERSLHGGLQLTLSTLRREYWVTRARTMVKRVIHTCIPCTRERATIPRQVMGDLPAARVSVPTRSFSHCGVDYAGPLFTRASGGRGISSRKSYIAVFVCLATRAVHLEAVSDYSALAFLNAFSRFCARRGLPSDMYSDNGTTFVGADRELSNAYKTSITDANFQNRTASDNIKWHFMPPSAPHFGGMWEAGVKSMKHHLHRVVGSHKLTFEELNTLLCRIEACLNSRPIAPLTDSPDEFDALTPGHFLIGTAITVSPERSTLDLHENRLNRWQLIRHLTERMWRTWSDDYINTLQQRTKWRKPHENIKVGRLVLLRNPTLPPCKWELARISQCHPGPDGFVRVVTVRTATSEYKRPIVKICLLPVESTQKTSLS